MKPLLKMSPAGLVITVAVTIAMIIDAWFVLIKGTGSSVSAWLVNAGFTSPLLVFGVGFLMGHLFGYMSPRNPKTNASKTLD